MYASAEKARERRDVGILCVITYDDLAPEAWTQSTERERERESEREIYLNY